MSEPIDLDPPRFRDDPTLAPAVGSALAAGRGYAPSAESRARTLAAIGVGVAVATTASGTSATAVVASPGVAKVLFGWKALAILVASAIGLGVGGYVALRGPSAPDTAPTATETTTMTTTTVTAAASGSTSVAPDPAAAPVIASEEIAPIVGSANASKPPVGKPKGSAGSDTLAAEVAAIDGARNALRSGDAAGALRLLDAYGRDFPKGSLGLEAQVLRIEALDASGQKQKARALAERFLAAHPNSVLAPRLKAVLSP